MHFYRLQYLKSISLSYRCLLSFPAVCNEPLNPTFVRGMYYVVNNYQLKNEAHEGYLNSAAQF